MVSFSIGKEIEVAQARLSVRKIREILRLRAEGFSERDIAGSVGVARSSIQICLWRAERAGRGLAAAGRPRRCGLGGTAISAPEAWRRGASDAGF